MLFLLPHMTAVTHTMRKKQALLAVLVSETFTDAFPGF